MRVTILADASYCSEYRVAGYGYWIACERGKRPGGGAMRDKVASSGIAEMMAVCNALHDAIKYQLVQAGDDVLIQTDCMDVITTLQRPVYSRSVTLPAGVVHVCKVFHKLCKDIKVTFRHVKGHTGKTEPRYAANRMCDIRAKRAMRQARQVLKATMDTVQ